MGPPCWAVNNVRQERSRGMAGAFQLQMRGWGLRTVGHGDGVMHRHCIMYLFITKISVRLATGQPERPDGQHSNSCPPKVTGQITLQAASGVWPSSYRHRKSAPTQALVSCDRPDTMHFAHLGDTCATQHGTARHSTPHHTTPQILNAHARQKPCRECRPEAQLRGTSSFLHFSLPSACTSRNGARLRLR